MCHPEIGPPGTIAAGVTQIAGEKASESIRSRSQPGAGKAPSPAPSSRRATRGGVPAPSCKSLFFCSLLTTHPASQKNRVRNVIRERLRKSTTLKNGPRGFSFFFFSLGFFILPSQQKIVQGSTERQRRRRYLAGAVGEHEGPRLPRQQVEERAGPARRRPQRRGRMR